MVLIQLYLTIYHMHFDTGSRYIYHALYHFNILWIRHLKWVYSLLTIDKNFLRMYPWHGHIISHSIWVKPGDENC